MKHILYNIKLAIVIISLPLLAACNDFLDKEPKGDFTDDTFWTSESNVKAYSWLFYDKFLGYGKGVGYSSEFYFQAGGSTMNISDDLMANTYIKYEGKAAVSNSDWKGSFESIRRANVMLDRLNKVPGMSKVESEHWQGVAKFFRAMEYFKLVQRFGDVPYYDYEIDVNNYNDVVKTFVPRMSRSEVMEKVFEDLDYAQGHIKQGVKANDKDGSVTYLTTELTQEAAWALMARASLFEGTFQKYHREDEVLSKKWIQRAKDAATKIMNAKYKLRPSFKETYNSEILGGSTDIILYKEYTLGILTHSVQAFNNTSTVINGMTKSAIDSYVCKDGLPISQSPLYKGDRSLTDILQDRDERLVAATETKDISYRGMKHRTPDLKGRVSTSGYVFALYNNPASQNVTTTGQNTIDAPVFTYAEALLIYAEACAELGNITNEDLNKSVNLLRARAGVAPLTVSGDVASAGGVVINDPARTSALETKTGQVSSILWEIRRERRAEFMGWTFMRYYDLMRWKKGLYLDFAENPQVNRGLYLGTIPEYLDPKDKKMKPEDIVLDADGYLIMYPKTDNVRKFNEQRDYLNSIPTDQISLYEREGVSFPQNPNW